MKRIFGIFSLAMLLFSTFTPSFTYAEVDDEYILNTFSSLLNGIGTERELNNLTENSDGSKTIISGDIEITIASSNQSTLSDGKYFWGNDTETSLSQTSDTRGEQFNDNRGGGNDILNNGYNGGLNQKRKGPCDDGRHVPSRGEWNDLAVAWCIQNENCNVETDISYNDDGTVKNLYNVEKTLGKLFKEDFSLQDGVYWTSTPYPGDNNKAFVESIGNAALVNSDSGRASRNYVRCFKDIIKSKTITYHPNGGAFSGMGVNETKEYTYYYSGMEIIPIYNIQIPNRNAELGENYSGWMFAGWYTKDGKDGDWGEEFDPDTSSITTVYAKWLPFNDLVLNLGGTDYIIMDRNLGAEGVAEGIYKDDNGGALESPEKWGLYYQWGNNYGFKNSGDNIIVNIANDERIDGLEYGPGNYYYSNKFKLNGGDTYVSGNLQNMRGGADLMNLDENRQGPCPTGYHIPTTKEFSRLYKIFSVNTPNYCNGSKYKCFIKTLKLPYINSLAYNSGLPDAGNGFSVSPSNIGGLASTLWTSESYDDYRQGYLFYMSPNREPNGKTQFVSGGYPIRCFKNVYKTNKLTLDFDNLDQNLEYDLKWWENITEYKPNNPTKKGFIFSGWKNEYNNTVLFTSNEYITSDTKIIADWNKNPWYYFRANGGAFQNGIEESTVKFERILIGSGNSHTDNLNDQRVRNGPYSTKVYDKTETIKINNATFLELEIRFYGNMGSVNDYLVIRTGEHLDYKPESYSGYDNIGIFSGTQYYNPKKIIVQGNTITLGFKSFQGNSGPDYGYLIIARGYKYNSEDTINNPANPGHEFLGWYEENSETPFDFNTPVTEDKTLYAHRKSLKEKTEETTTKNVVYTNTTTVTVGNEVTEETLSGSSTLTLVSKEVEDSEVKKEEDTTKVQDSEIKVTSDKNVEYEGGLEVYLEKTENETTEKVEGTIKFSAPVAVKIPIASDAEYVKVQVKHGNEDFGFKGLTLNPVNECNNGEALNDKYNGEDVLVTGNANKYATIYTCSASTFVAYTENKKPVEPAPSAGGGRTITSSKQETKITEQEHNSADTVKSETTQTPNQSVNTPVIEERVKKIEGRSLTRGEVAIMTSILLEVYPQLVEGKAELDDVTNACSNYADEQNFTKDEKKAITRLCKLSIMGIHRDTKEPLDEFLAKQIATNGEFVTVMNRTVANYTEKDLKVVKEALKKLEGDEGNVVFGTVYDVFMGIKNIFN